MAGRRSNAAHTMDVGNNDTEARSTDCTIRTVITPADERADSKMSHNLESERRLELPTAVKCTTSQTKYLLPLTQALLGRGYSTEKRVCNGRHPLLISKCSWQCYLFHSRNVGCHKYQTAHRSFMTSIVSVIVAIVVKLCSSLAKKEYSDL
jgi:hypothetical protein